MSKTLLMTEDVPAYIREIVPYLRLITEYKDGDIPGYTFKLYGKYKIGYEDQLRNNCEKLLNWCQRYYADAYVVSTHFWWSDVIPSRSDDFYTREHRRKAYREGYRNYIKIVITDPVAHRFEKDGYYREKQ